MESMNTKMEQDFTRLFSWIEHHSGLMTGKAFSIYHKWDVVNDHVMYTAALPVKEIPVELPAGFITGKIPASKVNTIVHTGPYKFLGNAYSTHYSMQRAKEYTYRKGTDPFETYVNLPGEVPDNELITEVHFPAK